MVRRLVVALLVALLAAVLVGPGLAGAVEPRTNHIITIPAAAFQPVNNSTVYANFGIQLSTSTGSGAFVAPVFFETPAVTINSITVYAYDNGGGDICVELDRATSWDGFGQTMGEVCSTGASPNYRHFTNSTAFDYRAVNGNYGPYLYLSMPGSSGDGYFFYGVRINYSY